MRLLVVRGADHQDMKERRRKASKPMDLSHEVLRIHCFARRQIRETRRRGSSKAVGRTIVYRRKFHRIPPGQASSLYILFMIWFQLLVCVDHLRVHIIIYMIRLVLGSLVIQYVLLASYIVDREVYVQTP